MAIPQWVISVGTLRHVMAVAVDNAAEIDKQGAYQIYVTDCLRLITRGLAQANGGGQWMGKRYIDIISPPPPTPGDDEIIDDVLNTLNRLGGDPTGEPA